MYDLIFTPYTLLSWRSLAPWPGALATSLSTHLYPRGATAKGLLPFACTGFACLAQAVQRHAHMPPIIAAPAHALAVFWVACLL